MCAVLNVTVNWQRDNLLNFLFELAGSDEEGSKAQRECSALITELLWAWLMEELTVRTEIQKAERRGYAN
jgi:hypothetical protein